ncbi:hypothetical protein [Pseudoxanthomonas winnipegensis]|uniref:Uncharacterized protein n=1 Tax=Pseudoxanthomonas winnipegensis TaxID=2480810 RepID=A0A4Q8L7X3_9GAMM|nr:hypothetical protein [Pseudoxanthomonas winnipegensis]RZZ81115.1 hypothetical protein EA662_19230 [Pseudoxanthomonas winnipegensis]TAA24060.1 hypothetical protein EA661_19575 [Pseudoxanthomonas winnipegensis]TBV71467.1 hypothetical protein EYC46_17700 [Pseudoxanthomonas winnipegensis]
MRYTKREDIPVQPGETGIELDDGSLVAVACTRAAGGNAVVFTATARAIDGQGTALLTAAGEPIATVLTHQDRDPAAADLVARDCLLAVLGEPVERVPWGEDYLRDVSIRNAISINSVPATVNVAEVL